MPDISLSPGESRKIVSQPPAGTKFNVDVDGTDVYLSHNSQAIVNQGRQLKAGDRVRLEDLRGSSVYAKNPDANTDNVTINVTEASFDLIYQARAVIGSVDTGQGDGDAPAASDDWDEATGAGVGIGSGGSTSETLTPPGRSDQVSIHVEGSAAFEVEVIWSNTKETYSSSSGAVKEVVPVYFISDGIDITITDTSGGTNAVDYDMAVV